MVFHGLPETCEYLKVARIMEIFQASTYKLFALLLFRLEAENYPGSLAEYHCPSTCTGCSKPFLSL